MYETTMLTTPEIQKFLGLGRNTILRLCQEKTYGFPAVRIGRTYKAEISRLAAWRDDWLNGKFDIF